jgi:hypothetical protein
MGQSSRVYAAGTREGVSQASHRPLLTTLIGPCDSPQCSHRPEPFALLHPESREVALLLSVAGGCLFDHFAAAISYFVEAHTK